MTQNVVSLNGGKVHTAMPGMEEHSYPLCRGGGMNQQLTKFRYTDAPVTCKTCNGYLERKAAKLASETTTPAPVAEEVPTVTLHTVKIGFTGSTYHLWEDGAAKTLCNKIAGTPNVFDHLEATCKTCIKRNAEKEVGATMAAAKKTTTAKTVVDVDTLTSEVHDIVDKLKEIDPSAEGALTLAGDLSAEADTRIRQLPTGLRNTLRKAVTEAREAVVKGADVAPVASTEVVRYSDDFNEYPGVTELVAKGAKKAREGVGYGRKMSSVSDELAQIILDMRTRIPNSTTGLPDLEAGEKRTKNAASAIYTTAKETLDKGDVAGEVTYDSLIKSAQNRMSDQLVSWLEAFDTTEDPAVLADIFPAAAEMVAESAEAAKAAEEDEDTDTEDVPAVIKPSEAIRAIYKEQGVSLPLKGRTEIQREYRLLKKLEKTQKALDAAKEAPVVDADAVAKLEAEVNELKETAPADVKLPPEKTAQEKAFEKIGKASELIEAATKGADKLTDDEKSDLKAKLDKLVSALAAASAKL